MLRVKLLFITPVIHFCVLCMGVSYGYLCNLTTDCSDMKWVAFRLFGTHPAFCMTIFICTIILHKTFSMDIRTFLNEFVEIVAFATLEYGEFIFKVFSHCLHVFLYFRPFLRKVSLPRVKK